MKKCLFSSLLFAAALITPTLSSAEVPQTANYVSTSSNFLMTFNMGKAQKSELTSETMKAAKQVQEFRDMSKALKSVGLNIEKDIQKIVLSSSLSQDPLQSFEKSLLITIETSIDLNDVLKKLISHNEKENWGMGLVSSKLGAHNIYTVDKTFSFAILNKNFVGSTDQTLLAQYLDAYKAQSNTLSKNKALSEALKTCRSSDELCIVQVINSDLQKQISQSDPLYQEPDETNEDGTVVKGLSFSAGDIQAAVLSVGLTKGLQILTALHMANKDSAVSTTTLAQKLQPQGAAVAQSELPMLKPLFDNLKISSSGKTVMVQSSIDSKQLKALIKELTH